MTKWQGSQFDDGRWAILVEEPRLDGRLRRNAVICRAPGKLAETVQHLTAWLTEKRAEDAAWLARKAVRNDG